MRMKLSLRGKFFIMILFSFLILSVFTIILLLANRDEITLESSTTEVKHENGNEKKVNNEFKKDESGSKEKPRDLSDNHEKENKTPAKKSNKVVDGTEDKVSLPSKEGSSAQKPIKRTEDIKEPINQPVQKPTIKPAIKPDPPK